MQQNKRKTAVNSSFVANKFGQLSMGSYAQGE